MPVTDETIVFYLTTEGTVAREVLMEDSFAAAVDTVEDYPNCAYVLGALALTCVNRANVSATFPNNETPFLSLITLLGL